MHESESSGLSKELWSTQPEPIFFDSKVGAPFPKQILNRPFWLSWVI